MPISLGASAVGVGGGTDAARLRLGGDGSYTTSPGMYRCHHDGMEPLFVWVVLLVALIALDVCALRWGVDSRDGLPDDHRR